LARSTFFGQVVEGLPVVIGPAGPRLGGDVVEPIVEAMIAEPRRLQGPATERLLQVGLEEGGQALLLALGGVGG
jgi:hypothetical protein